MSMKTKALQVPNTVLIIKIKYYTFLLLLNKCLTV